MLTVSGPRLKRDANSRELSGCLQAPGSGDASTEARALADSFKQQYPGGHRHIQAFHATRHRNMHHLITVFAGEGAHATLFSADDDRHIATELALRPGLFPFTGCADDPDPGILQPGPEPVTDRHPEWRQYDREFRDLNQ